MNKKIKEKKGFALLFTIVVVSLLLSIAVGISDITYKQQILSSLAESSKIASNQSENALECALYYSLQIFDPDLSVAQQTITCGPGASNVLSYSATDFGGSYIYSNWNSLDAPCYYIKAASSTTNGTTYTLEGHGFNICKSSSIRRVERVEIVNF